MPTLAEVLADKAKYQDNLVWKFDDTTSVTLGQLRQLSAERQSTLSKQEEDIKKAQGEIALAERKLKESQVQTATVYDTLNKAMEAIKSGRLTDPAVTQIFGNTGIPGVGPTGPADPFAELARLEGDTLMGPLVKVLKLVNERASKADQSVAANIEVQKKMAINYINGVLEDRYDRLVPVDKQDKIKLEDLIKDAISHNEVRSDSTPDIRKAYQRATAADTQAAHDAQVAADAIKKYKEEHPEPDGINVPAGGSNFFGLDVHNRGGDAAKPYKNLDEAFAAAAKDKDIWTAVDQMTH